MLQCVAVCCSVLQCVAMCVAVCGSVLYVCVRGVKKSVCGVGEIFHVYVCVGSNFFMGKIYMYVCVGKRLCMCEWENLCMRVCVCLCVREDCVFVCVCGVIVFLVFVCGDKFLETFI